MKTINSVLSYPQQISIANTSVKKYDGKHLWFPGLNALRFFAAALVVLMHVHNNMKTAGLPQLPDMSILFKGVSAVSFFFVLSGFLITYLLFTERKNTKTISIKNFYLRRVFRIWPLYFLVIGFGAFFYWQIVPALHLNFENAYPHGLAVLLYTFFLANLMNSLYHVGGILHITWSIAVEEQFYLFWAPLVKSVTKNSLRLIIITGIISLSVNILNTINVFELSKEWQSFINTLQFHYMAIGALFAWLLFYKRDWLLSLPVFNNKILQVVLLSLLTSYFFFYTKTVAGEILTPLPLGFLFAWLIITVSSSGKCIINLERPWLNYLGKISYGIYMFHMPVVYASSFFFQKMNSITKHPVIYFPLFYAMVFSITIAIAAFSYRFIEQPILRKGKTVTG